jgi:hypothetical protein
MPLVKVSLICKECAREFVRELPDEIVRAAKDTGSSLTGSCDACIEGGHAGPIKKLIWELNRQKRGVRDGE